MNTNTRTYNTRKRGREKNTSNDDETLEKQRQKVLEQNAKNKKLI